MSPEDQKLIADGIHEAIVGVSSRELIDFIRSIGSRRTNFYTIIAIQI